MFQRLRVANFGTQTSRRRMLATMPTPRSTAHPLRRRIVALGISALFVGAGLSARIHMATVAHGYSVAHHELTHLLSGTATRPVATPALRARIPSAGDDDTCLAAALLSTPLTPPSPTRSGALLAHALVVPNVSLRSTLARSIPLLASAPKHSPPQV